MLRVAVAAGDGAEELRGLHYPLTDTLVALAMDTGRGSESARSAKNSATAFISARWSTSVR